MHVQDGECAHCGRRLKPDFRDVEFNKNWHRLAVNNVRPYFCSEKCSGAAIRERLSPAYGDHGTKIEDIISRYKHDFVIAQIDEDWRRESSIRSQCEYEVDEEKKRQKQKDADYLEEACVKVAQTYAHEHSLFRKGLMVASLQGLQVFAPGQRLADRLLVIDPGEKPALGMFALQSTNLNHLVEQFSYIFSTADAKLTQRQSIPFSFVARLVFAMRGDLMTLMDLLDDEPRTASV